MIDREELSRIVSALDDEMHDVVRRTGKAGLPRWAERYGVSEDGLIHVAMQRAMRAMMRRRGEAIPTTAQRVEMTDEELEDTRENAALWVDGFAAGLKVARPINVMHIPDGERRSE